MSDIFSGIQTYQKMLTYHLNRHKVIASNIANLDTPGFVSKDLAPPEIENEGENEFNLMMERHNPDADKQNFDIFENENNEGKNSRLFDDPSAVPGNDGNAVDLDREMGKLAANTIKYQAVATIVIKQLGMLRYAANDAK